MTKIKLKNLILSLFIAFAMIVGINSNFVAYAAGEEIVARAISLYGNAIGVTAQDTHVEAVGEFSFSIPESEQSSTIEITLFDSDGNDFGNITTLDAQSPYDKEISINSTLVDMIRYNNSQVAVYGKVNSGVPQLGNFNFMYQATVTRTDTSTYTTDKVPMIAIFYREGIALTQSQITVYQGHSLPDQETLRSYIQEAYLNNVKVDNSQITINTSEVNTNVLGYYNIIYTYNEEITNYLEVNVVEDASNFEWDIYYDGDIITGTNETPYNFGTVSSLDNITLRVMYNDESAVVSTTASFDKEGFSISSSPINSTITEIQIIAPKGFNETVTGIITLDSMKYNLQKTLVFRATYNIDTAPIINFTSQDEIIFNKKCQLVDLEDWLRQLVDNITEYDGSKVDGDLLLDPTILVISHNVTDTATSGTYQATYSYTSTISGLTATATKEFVLSNEKPTIDSIYAQVDGKEIVNGVALEPGQTIDFQVEASDLDLDEVTIIIDTTSGSVVLNSTEENSDNNTTTCTFTFTPNAKFVGGVTFTIYCNDQEDISEESISILVIYIDNTKPTITFASDIIDNSGSYEVHVDKNTPISFGQMIASVNDNIDTLTNQNVTIAATGFNLDAQNRAIFTITGNYKVTYTATDNSGNSTTYQVSVIVNNSAPVATDVDGGVHTYGTQVEINLNDYVTDLDNDNLNFYRDGVVFDQDDNTVVVDYYNIDLLTGMLTLRPTAKYVGSIKLQYHAVDIDGRASSIHYINIRFIDNLAPVVTRTGLRTDFVINKSQGYDKYGFYTAYDAIDGDNITTTLTITNIDSGEEVDDIDFTKTGSYRFNYTFKDQSPNSLPALASIVVNVTKGSNPEIKLVADSATVEVGTRFSIFDYIAQIDDEEDGVKTSGFVDMYNSGYLKLSKIPTTDTVGKVVVSMYYVDSDGNLSDTITFTLIVEKPATISPYYFIAGGAAVVLAIAIMLIAIFVRRSKMRV